MKRWLIPLILAFIVFFTFSVRAVYLWRDFVFVYDQGRDAIQVQKILHGDLTLIGPTTGLFGVFLGPLHYYLLTIPYLLGGGNPIVPAYFFVFLTSLTVVPIFILARKIGGRWAGMLAVFFYSFSFVQWVFSRWLSNPTNLPLVSTLMFISALRALETKRRSWFVLVGLLLGICLQLEAANAVFLIPTLLLILGLEYFLKVKSKFGLKEKLGKLVAKLVADKGLIILTFVGFFVTLVPQLLFELLHNFLSTRGLFASFGTMKGPPLLENLPKRIETLIDLYARGLFWRASWNHIAFAIVVIGVLWITWLLRRKLLSSQAFRVAVIWFLVPLFFHLTYTGNYGNFWDYYIIGQYPVFYILIAAITVSGWKQKGLARGLALLLSIVTLVGVFVPNVSEWFKLSVPYRDRISLSLELDAIDWVEKRAGQNPFGMWAYTPSAQDDVYKYLFSYRARYNGILPVEHPEQTKLMYLIVEDDPGNPKRREDWIKSMAAIGTIKAQNRFGIITVFEVERKLMR